MSVPTCDRENQSDGKAEEEEEEGGKGTPWLR